MYTLLITVTDYRRARGHRPATAAGDIQANVVDQAGKVVQAVDSIDDFRWPFYMTELPERPQAMIDDLQAKLAGKVPVKVEYR